jgi:hypothetical protein
MPGIASRRSFNEILSGVIHSVMDGLFRGEGEYWLAEATAAAWLHQLEKFLVDLAHHDDGEESTDQSFNEMDLLQDVVKINNRDDAVQGRVGRGVRQASSSTASNFPKTI